MLVPLLLWMEYTYVVIFPGVTYLFVPTWFDALFSSLDLLSYCIAEMSHSKLQEHVCKSRPFWDGLLHDGCRNCSHCRVLHRLLHESLAGSVSCLGWIYVRQSFIVSIAMAKTKIQKFGCLISESKLSPTVFNAGKNPRKSREVGLQHPLLPLAALRDALAASCQIKEGRRRIPSRAQAGSRQFKLKLCEAPTVVRSSRNDKATTCMPACVRAWFLVLALLLT